MLRSRFLATLLPLISALALTTAHAQQAWTSVSGDIKYQLLGCARQANADIQCEVTAIYTGQGLNARRQFQASQSVATDTAGRAYPASSIAVGNAAPSTVVTVYPSKNEPLHLTFAFRGYPAATAFRSLDIAEGHLQGVAIQAYVPPAAPVVVAPPVNPNAYTIQLTGCTPTTGGAYTCTGATVTPKR